MSVRTIASGKRRRHHGQLHLPELTAHESLLLCNLMDRAICALWRTNGEIMTELLCRLDRAQKPPVAAEPPSATDPIDDIF
jgi:hypothetical protein